MLLEFATAAVTVPPVVTFAVRAVPTAVWQLASCAIVPLLSAAPTPMPSSCARATAKSFVEPVVVVRESAVRRLRQTCMFVDMQSGSSSPV